MGWKTTLLVAVVLALAPALPSGVLAQGQLSEQSPTRSETMGAEPRVEVDAVTGEPVDPSKNVLDLVQAAIERQDDLRDSQDDKIEGSERFLLMLLEQAEKLNAVSFESNKLLREADVRRIDEGNSTRAYYEDKLAEKDAELAKKESERIDAIRSVDVAAAQNESEQAAQRANVLSTNADTDAEALRSLVDSTEQSLAVNQRQITTEFSNRLTALEQQGNIGRGRQELSDPALIDLTAAVQRLSSAQNTSVGQAQGASNLVGFISVGVGIFVGLSILGGVLAAVLRRPAPIPTPVNGYGGYGNGNGNGNVNGYDDRPRRTRRKAVA